MTGENEQSIPSRGSQRDPLAYPRWPKWLRAIFSRVPQPAITADEMSALWFLYAHCDKHSQEEAEKGEEVVARMWRGQRDIVGGLLKRLV